MPKQITTEELLDVIGDDLFHQCMDKFKGRQYYFKKKTNPLHFKNQDEKKEFIYNASIKSGLNFNQIGDKLDLSADHVRRLFYEVVEQKKSVSGSSGNSELSSES